MQFKLNEMRQIINALNNWCSGMHLDVCFTLVLILFTGTYSQAQQVPFKVFAHRGFRGLHPENTIRGLQKALTYGAVLEFDLAITRDKQVVVSHDPVLNPKITQGPNGQKLGNDKIRIYQMDYETLIAYDVGKTPNRDFPEQERYPAYIPLFRELVDSVEAFAAARGISDPTYFIETKLNHKTDGINHPGPKEFVDLMMQVVKERGIQKQVIVQSFDPRTLQILRKEYPQIKLALLAKDSTSLDDNLNALGFVPEYYSINAPYINQELVDQCHERKTKLIVGNCDDYEETLRIAKLGVNSVISDYPMEWLSGRNDKKKKN
jgi:glycerophosphoryl diester phosphodiesterase